MKDKIRKVILVICVCVFAYSAFQLGKIFYEYYSIEKESENLIDEYVVEKEENPIQRAVNFKALQATNPDVIGWLYIPDTKIDEPILKGKINDTYLYTDIYKKKNKAGSVFIDEINKKDFSDDNTIIYGHNMKNGSRFHDLRYFVKEDYYKKHSTIYIYLPDGSVNVYDAVASAVIKSTSSMYQKGIDYPKYVKEIQKIASVQSPISEKQKPFIMLSTCYNGTDNRYIVYGQFKENIKQ